MSRLVARDGGMYVLCPVCGKDVKFASEDCVEIGVVPHIRQPGDDRTKNIFVHRWCKLKIQPKVDMFLWKMEHAIRRQEARERRKQ